MEYKRTNLTFYKPNRQGNGAASQWEFSERNNCVFLEGASQVGTDENGNARFGWDQKITVKMELSDLGKIISVLSNREKEAKIFHEVKSGENKGATKIVQLVKLDNGFGFRLSEQTPDKKTSAVKHMLGNDEASLLYAGLSGLIPRLLNWY